jgi:hypothetical protein
MKGYEVDIKEVMRGWSEFIWLKKRFNGGVF